MVLRRPKSRIILVLIGLVAAAAPALADDHARASDHARRAVALYEVGRFEEARAEFERAYILYPTDTLLFNLAQTHRRLDHCRQALELYRRLLERSPGSPRAPAVRRLLPELEKACRVQDQDPRGVQPQDSESSRASAEEPSPTPALLRVSAAPIPSHNSDASIAAVRAPRRPRVFAAATAGAIAAGGESVTPVGAIAGATWRTRRVPVELGVAAVGAGFAWASGGHRGTSSSAAVLATAGRSFPQASIEIRVDVGAGLAVLGGITASHPLLAPGRRVDGGTAIVPELDLLASGQRALGGGWSAVGGVRVGAAYGEAFGGLLLSVSVLLGLGHDL